MINNYMDIYPFKIFPTFPIRGKIYMVKIENVYSPIQPAKHKFINYKQI